MRADSMRQTGILSVIFLFLAILSACGDKTQSVYEAPEVSESSDEEEASDSEPVEESEEEASGSEPVEESEEEASGSEPVEESEEELLVVSLQRKLNR